MWGLTWLVPTDYKETCVAAWGARAIYNEKFIELLADRQGFRTASDWEGKPDDATSKPLLRWLAKKGLPALRKWIKDNYIPMSSDKEFRFHDGEFELAATPNGSYGYMYINAWRKKT